MPDEALAAGAKVVATGRSDFPNQINNVLVFPGIFKGALKARASQITEDMEVAAAEAIAGLVPEDKLAPDYIIPSALDKSVADVVAKAVADRA
jgi:malate dehydrogenase (oxaloacetate-decarboxylating)